MAPLIVIIPHILKMHPQNRNPNSNPIPIPIPIPLTPSNPPHKKLPLPCPILTRLLAGGLPIGLITELSGESSSGKTQLLLPLLVLHSPSLFIHSQPPSFPLPRLLSLLSSNPNPNPNPLDDIFIAGAHSPLHLLSLLSHAETALLPLRRFKLIIVDSITAMFRSDFDNNAADLKRRSGLFFRIASKLKEIAREFELAVVVTNQVVDVVEDNNTIRVGNYRELWTSGRRVWPAMGLGWASCVNVRLFLEREEEEEDDVGVGRMRTRRWMRVVFAPHLPEGVAEFVIVKQGVFGIER